MCPKKFIKNSVLVSEEFQMLAIPFCFMSMDLGMETPMSLCCSLVVSWIDLLMTTLNAAKTKKNKKGALTYYTDFSELSSLDWSPYPMKCSKILNGWKGSTATGTPLNILLMTLIMTKVIRAVASCAGCRCFLIDLLRPVRAEMLLWYSCCSFSLIPLSVFLQSLCFFSSSCYLVRSCLYWVSTSL